jgi:hypothetical protein
LNSNPDWKSGDTVLLRGVWRSKLWFAIVTYIVQDTDDLIALYWRADTPNKVPGWRLTAQDLLVEAQLKLTDSAWTRTDVLMLVKPGDSHSVELMWDGKTGEFLCWYVNLQLPLCRTPISFDTMDLALDVVISPDKSKWRWKDEDEFAEMIDLGLISTPDGQAFALKEKVSFIWLNRISRLFAMVGKNGSPQIIGPSQPSQPIGVK